ncbi:Cdc6/Cdc18 family protein [Nanoarchaeota archaeon]
MSMFKDMLGSDQTLFRDHVPLDFDFIPKLVPFREDEQRKIAMCIKPLFAQRNGRNVFMHGPPGVGKTVACKHLIRELEEETDDIIPIYINCWQKNTSYKILVQICEELDYKFTHNKKTDELMAIVKNILNKKSAVLVFDEVDKLDETDFLYFILEDIYRKTIILITNFKDWIVDLDNRIKSRLTAELIEFKAYNKQETHGILKQRMEYAFVPGVWDDANFNIIASKAYELKDIRAGLYLLKEATNAAEDEASKKVEKKNIDTALQKLNDFYIKKDEGLDEETKFILKIAKNNPNQKIGDLFNIYKKEGGENGYKTFQRKISKLAEGKFISVTKVSGGTGGSTTIVESTGSTKKLTDF